MYPRSQARRHAARRRWRGRFLLAALILPALHGLSSGQTRLTLDAAVARASTANTDVGAALAAEREADARLVQARSGLLPSVDFTETWHRGNQPVFVFSSLLAQRQFAAANFAVDALNRPGALTNYRSAVTLDAPLFDGSTRAAVLSATLAVDIAGLQPETVRRDLAVAVTAAYGAVVNAAAMGRTIAASLESAQADLALVERRRDQGLVTDADVLQMTLHLAATRERQIRAAADEAIARARLNQLMGAGLDDRFELAEPTATEDTEEPTGPSTALADLEMQALARRSEGRLASLNQSLADAALVAARAAFLPKVSAMAVWEGNGSHLDTRTSGWLVGAVARVNLFRGFADTARLAEARALQQRRAAEREGIQTAIRVDVREVQARLDAARAVVEVAEAAMVHATESHRIVRDRYEAGLVDVTALLRAAEGVQAAQARRVSARVELMVARAAWRRAVGR